MIIVNYTNFDYKDCLTFTKQSWKADKIIIYSDTDDFGVKKYQPTKDFDEHCRRKILTIQDVIKNNKGKDILYLDTDVYMRKNPIEVFQDNPNADLILTRMVRRDRIHHPEINAGVIFIRANDKTEKMCERWLELDLQNRGKARYPEQNALNRIGYEGYDNLIDLKVANVSENIYNFERDSKQEFLKDMNKASLVHFKNGFWKIGKLVSALKRLD